MNRSFQLAAYAGMALLALILGLNAPVATANAQSGGQRQGEATAPSPTEIKKAMLKAFLDTARIKDLLSVTQPGQGKMTDAERAMFSEQMRSVQSDLATLEKWRYQFLYHVSNLAYGRNTASALATLLNHLHQLETAVSQFGSPAQAAQFDQPGKELGSIQNEVQSYLASLAPQPETQAASPAKSSSSETKRIVAHAVPTPLITPHQPAKTAASPAHAETAATVAEASAPAAGQIKQAMLEAYLNTARIKDLLSVAQPGRWKMTDAERAMFTEQAQAVQSDLAALEKWRYQFSYHLGDLEYGKNTEAALAVLLDHLHQLETAISQFESPAQAAQFDQPGKALAGIQNQLQSYLANRTAQQERKMAALTNANGLETVRIVPRTAPPPPLSAFGPAKPPLTSVQVKAILNQVYMSVFRIRDLLSQEHPASWKTSSPERAVGELARTALLSRADRIERWRALFNEHPDNMYDAFQVYRTVENLFLPLDVFRRSVAEHENTALAGNYAMTAAALQNSLDQLTPYIGFILEHESNGIALYRADLANCQTKLGYAMHGLLPAPNALHDVLPVFQGRHTASRKSKSDRRGTSHRRRQHAGER